MIDSRRSFITRTSFLILILILLTGRPSLAADVIRINGSGSGLHMIKPITLAYAKAHPEVQFEMDNPLGSSGSIKALLSGVLDIAISSRPLNPREAASGAILQKYGQTPLAIVTNMDVGKKDITTQELVTFYRNRTANWPDGKKVRLVLRPLEDTDTRIICNLSPEMDTAMTIAQSQPGMIVAVTDPEASETIARTPGALGASGLTGVIVEQFLLNVMKLNGVEPTPETLAKGVYPLGKELNIVTSGALSEPAIKFLSFVYSLEGRSIALSAGVWITVGEQSPW
jgi:phosphate transport system substrate-binding protein